MGPKRIHLSYVSKKNKERNGEKFWKHKKVWMLTCGKELKKKLENMKKKENDKIFCKFLNLHF